MVLHEVLPSHTPNEGRITWNANDQALLARLDSLALNVALPPYAAARDGVKDDRAALQAAIDDCHAAGGGTVYLPVGAYALGGSLLLRDDVNLIGAGMYATTVRLADGINQPVITDESVGVEGAYAVGPVMLANFAIDGNKANNPAGQEGIATSAYFSTFQSLSIQNCRTHGLRLGFSGQANWASQNRVVGCRIRDCDDTGLLLDINGPDQIVSQNFIYNCAYGVVIKNGGVRVVNNVIYGHAQAAIQVKQTANNVIIAANDLNGSARHVIHITRTSVANDRSWGMMLITSNSILGNDLIADNEFDGILVQTDVPDGIAKITITGNKIFTYGEENRFRYGINLESNVLQAHCSDNHITDVAAAPYHIGTTCRAIELDSVGGGMVAAPPVPLSDVPFANPYHVPVTLHISGGAVTSVALNGTPTGLTSGTFRLLPNQAITLTYTAMPTWTWFAD